MQYVLESCIPITNADCCLQGPFTHGFVVQFETEADRDYYVSEDPAHQDFIKFAGEILQNVKVIDYEPGKL